MGVFNGSSANWKAEAWLSKISRIFLSAPSFPSNLVVDFLPLKAQEDHHQHYLSVDTSNGALLVLLTVVATSAED